jgi:hypothetical protein
MSYNFQSRLSSESEDTLSNGDRSDILLEVPSLKKISDNTEETMIFRGNNSYLLCLYESLYGIFTHYCGVVAEFLNSLDNIYDLLAEYTSRVSYSSSREIIFSGKPSSVACWSWKIFWRASQNN